MIRNFLRATVLITVAPWIFATVATTFAGTHRVFPSDNEIHKILTERVGENEKDVGIVVGVIDSQNTSKSQ